MKSHVVADVVCDFVVSVWTRINSRIQRVISTVILTGLAMLAMGGDYDIASTVAFVAGAVAYLTWGLVDGRARVMRETVRNTVSWVSLPTTTVANLKDKRDRLQGMFDNEASPEGKHLSRRLVAIIDLELIKRTVSAEDDERVIILAK